MNLEERFAALEKADELIQRELDLLKSKVEALEIMLGTLGEVSVQTPPLREAETEQKSIIEEVNTSSFGVTESKLSDFDSQLSALLGLDDSKEETETTLIDDVVANLASETSEKEEAPSTFEGFTPFLGDNGTVPPELAYDEDDDEDDEDEDEDGNDGESNVTNPPEWEEDDEAPNNESDVIQNEEVPSTLGEGVIKPLDLDGVEDEEAPDTQSDTTQTEEATEVQNSENEPAITENESEIEENKGQTVGATNGPESAGGGNCDSAEDSDTLGGSTVDEVDPMEVINRLDQVNDGDSILNEFMGDWFGSADLLDGATEITLGGKD